MAQLRKDRIPSDYAAAVVERVIRDGKLTVAEFRNYLRVVKLEHELHALRSEMTKPKAVAPVAVKKPRKPTAKQIAARRVTGRYMGLLAKMKNSSDRAAVKKVRASDGVAVAIVEAEKRLGL